MSIQIEDLVTYPLIKEDIQATIALLFVFLVVHFAKVVASKKIEEKNRRYKTRKAIGMAGYLLALVSVR